MPSSEFGHVTRASCLLIHLPQMQSSSEYRIYTCRAAKNIFLSRNWLTWLPLQVTFLWTNLQFSEVPVFHKFPWKLLKLPEFCNATCRHTLTHAHTRSLLPYLLYCLSSVMIITIEFCMQRGCGRWSLFFLLFMSISCAQVAALSPQMMSCLRQFDLFRHHHGDCECSPPYI